MVFNRRIELGDNARAFLTGFFVALGAAVTMLLAVLAYIYL